MINQLHSIHLSSSASRERALSHSDLDESLVLSSFLHVCLATALLGSSLDSDYCHQAQCDSEREEVNSVRGELAFIQGCCFVLVLSWKEPLSREQAEVPLPPLSPQQPVLPLLSHRSHSMTISRLLVFLPAKTVSSRVRLNLGPPQS